MEGRDLDVMILSAKGINNVKHISKMDVYTVVRLSGDAKAGAQTHIEKDGGTNPTWNFPVQFKIDEASARRNNEELIFHLFCERRHRGDKEIGEVRVPLRELLDSSGDSRTTKVVSYHVKQPGGKARGELKFSYKFGDRVVEAVPYSSGSTTSSYPPVGFPQMDQPPAGYPAGGVVYPESSGGVPQCGFEVVQPERTNEVVDVELLVGVLNGLLSGELVIEVPADQAVGAAAKSSSGATSAARRARAD